MFSRRCARQEGDVGRTPVHVNHVWETGRQPGCRAVSYPDGYVGRGALYFTIIHGVIGRLERKMSIPR